MFVLLVSGLGYGIISGLFAMVNVLADITGPGSLGLKDDVPQNFLIVSGKLCKFKVSLCILSSSSFLQKTVILWTWYMYMYTALTYAKG